ncbi:MAG TPA: valine--tRNA ligase [Candidatus Paceibacterota bacterium]
MSKRYSILMPPPNLTGEPHVGHVMQHLIMDAIARRKRAEGFDVLFQPGVDHAGIQFEGTLNKMLAKENLSKEKLGREEWLKRAWKFKDEIYKSFHNTWKMMNISADWDKEVFTLDPKVQQAVFHQFKTFWEDDLLYKGAYIVQWCPKDGTAIEDIEMDYQEKKEILYFVKYKIYEPESKDSFKENHNKNSPSYIVVATARPETISADVAIAVYPNHPKFKKFVGQNAINPFTGKLIPIIEDERVQKDFGTGALKITPGHDMLDYEIGKTHSLPILHAVGKDGRITNLDSELVGLKIEEARKKAAEKLEVSDLIEKKEEYTHSVPVCERCGTTVEPLISTEWFVRMKTLKENGLTNIKKINFIPDHYLKTILEWIENIHDWSISRSLWWGHRIPVWYCAICNTAQEVGKDKDMIVSIETPGKSCDRCGKKQWVQDEQILDTWFSSGLWPLATLGFPNKTKELEKYFPWDFEISAPEIKFLWIARMIMISSYLKNEIPFRNMFFHGTLRDPEGRKFSKSLGNGLYPEQFVKEWGADALRAALFTYSAPGRDGRVGKQALNERCKNFRNFGTKLKNIAKFILDLKPEKNSDTKSKTPHPEDEEILKKLAQIETEIEKHFNLFELHLALEKIYNFIWHEFADTYIEQSKKRRAEAQGCLETILKKSTALIAPFMPTLADDIIEKWPQ